MKTSDWRELAWGRTGLKYRRRRPPLGSMPGTLVVDHEAPPTEMTVLGYGPESLVEETVTDLDRLADLNENWPVTWLNVTGLGDERQLREIAERLSLHRLVMEDVANLGQRSKAEPFDESLFIVLRMPIGDSSGTEQVSMLLQQGLVVTFQERSGDCFDPVRDRIRTSRGKIRFQGADYLSYALADAVLDQYFPVLEKAGNLLDDLEDEVFNAPTPDTLAHIHSLKRGLVSIRKAVWPHREMINVLLRDGGAFYETETQLYLRDAYDHVVRLIDLVEAQREVAADLLNTYLSSVSNRMNEVMKVLTIIATIFIPLSFIAGLYGMNFDTSISRWNMPELGLAWGYPAALLGMLAVAVGLLVFIRRKGWI
jgi:magnesium transporter